MLRRLVAGGLLCLTVGYVLQDRPAAQGVGSITGTVTDATLSAPVPDVVMSFYASNGSLIGSTTTDTLGQYTSPPLASGSYMVQADPPGASGLLGQLFNNIACPAGACTITSGTLVAVTAPSTTPNINFTLQAGGTITGSVSDATTLLLVPGVPINVYANDGSLIGSTITDGLGQYISPALPSGSYFVEADPLGRSDLLNQLYNTLPCLGSTCTITTGTPVAVTAPDAVPNINFSLQLGGTITGTVFSANTGARVPAAMVTFFTSNGSVIETTSTDAQGDYTSPPLPRGSYLLQADPPIGSELLSQVYYEMPCTNGICTLTTGTLVSVIVPPHATSGINFELQTGGAITGTVRSAATSAAVPNVDVSVYTTTGSLIGITSTDALGHYTSPALASGSYIVQADPPSSSGLLIQLYDNVACPGGVCPIATGTPVAMAGSGDVTGIDLSLARAPVPPNDTYAGGLVIDHSLYSSVENTSTATTTAEDPAPTCGNHSTQNSVWYTLTVPSDGTLTADTFGSNYDTILSIYTGAPGGFTSVACNDDAAGTFQSQVSLAVVAGQHLAILVSSNIAGAGWLTLSVTSPSAPITATPTPLRFGATKAGAAGAVTNVTPAQMVTVGFNGPWTAWTAAANQPWLQVAGGSGAASGQFTVGIINPANVIGGSTALSGTITLTAPNAPNSPLVVPVTLTVDQTGVSTAPPIGLVDTPQQNSTGQVGAIGVTGWAVDDVGVRSVKIYRNCLGFEPAIDCASVAGFNLAFIGEATLVSGARPDIEAQYPSYPQAYRAAWGYLLLTNLLPHVPNQQMSGGQGTLVLYALAEDLEGHQRWLGRNFVAYPTVTDQVPTTFTMANDTIAKPFGAIDTPTQGQTVSGSFWNFGWTLTPDSNTTAGAGDILMPLDGSTQWVYIDGAPVAPIGAYNLCRGTVGSPVPAGLYCDDDVASIFGNLTPQPTFTPRTANPTKFRNLDAASGSMAGFYLNTTTLSNGVHTIVWGVTDSAGRGEGIGSRYFTVLNGSFDSRPDGTALAQDRSADAVPAGSASYGGTSAADAVASRRMPTVAEDVVLRDAPAQTRGLASALDPLTPARGRVWGRTGFDPQAPYVEMTADDAGVRHVQIPDLGRIELGLGAVEQGYLVANGTLRDLPPGSRLDPETGQFTWAPGLGYLGTYRLAFVRRDTQLLVDVTVRPADAPMSGQSEIRMQLDLPTDGATVAGTVRVAGWVLDPQAAIGTGIGAVHVWARRHDQPGAAPEFLGAAALGGARSDLAQDFGPQFGTAAFDLTVTSLASGQYDLTVYAWNLRTARWEDARTVTVTVR